MREAGRIAAGARTAARLALRPGITTGEIDQAVHAYILSQNAVPTFLGYSGFPASSCISVNDEVIHGIPGKRVIHEGDIVSIDVGATYKGYVGDCAGTYPVGQVSKEALELIDIKLRLRLRIQDIGHRTRPDDIVRLQRFDHIRFTLLILFEHRKHTIQHHLRDPVCHLIIYIF